MSSRVPRWALLSALVALGLPPAGAVAQQTEEELVRHIDSLLPLLRQAEIEAAEAKVLRDEAQRLASAPATDTFHVGPIRIVTLPDERDVAEEIYRTVWDREYAPFVASSPSMDGHVFTFMWGRALVPIYVDGPVRRVEMRGWRPRAAVEEAVRAGLSSVLALDLRETELSLWSNGIVRRSLEPDEIYRDLALSASQASRACLEGDPGSCWLALGLETGVDGYPLDEWYSPEERQALVGQARSWSRQQKPLWDACVGDGQVSSCDLFLEERIKGVYGGLAQYAPLDAQSRAAMLWIAVRMGGEGAWDRLREDPEATPAQALLYASGASRDELARAWLAYVMEHQPASRAGTGISALLALMWIAGFGALAMRSTRWRLG